MTAMQRKLGQDEQNKIHNVHTVDLVGIAMLLVFVAAGHEDGRSVSLRTWIGEGRTR